MDKIVADRQAGKVRGRDRASVRSLKLGHVISEVKKADKAAEYSVGRPDAKVAKDRQARQTGQAREDRQA